MTRKHYNNGDEISLACGCDGCSPSRINGVLCHETGCPDAWRDQVRECKNCGSDFSPENKRDEFCSDECAKMYFGDWDNEIEAEESDEQDSEPDRAYAAGYAYACGYHD